MEGEGLADVKADKDDDNNSGNKGEGKKEEDKIGELVEEQKEQSGSGRGGV